MFWAIVDLPTPFGPTSTTLVASLRNSSVISASTAARSQRLGQDQLKSQSGLNRPMWAERARRSRPRRARSCSSQPSNGMSQGSAATSFQCASSPCKLSAAALARCVSGSVIGWVLELIIGFERMWLHRRVAVAHMRGQHHGDGRIAALLLSLTLQREADRVRVRHIAFQRLEDGGLHRGGIVTVEQPQQTGCDGAETAAAFGRAFEQGLAGGHSARETIVAAMLACRVFEINQRLDVGGLFDLG